MAICFYRFPGEIVTFKNDKDGHWIVVVINLEASFAILVNIYGYNNISQINLLLGNLTLIITEYKQTYAIAFTLIGGDF